MAILWGDTGKVAYGSLKTFNFKCSMREISLGTITLPSTEGTINQISFTIQQSDLPTITPNPLSLKYTPLIISSGKCITAATISYRIFKNGTSLVTSTHNGTANQYWTDSHYRWYDVGVAVGDVLEIRLWSNQTDTNVDYACLMILPSNVVLSKLNAILKDVTYTNGTTANAMPKPTGLGLRTVNDDIAPGAGWFPIAKGTSIASSNGLTNVSVSSGTPLVFPYLSQDSNGIFRTYYGGDVSPTVTKNGGNSATQMNIIRDGVPDSISFREILR